MSSLQPHDNTVRAECSADKGGAMNSASCNGSVSELRSAVPGNDAHPGGRVRHSGFVQLLRMILFIDYLISYCSV